MTRMAARRGGGSDHCPAAGSRAPCAEIDPQAFLDAFDEFAQAVRRARGVPASDGEGGLSLTFSQYALIRALAGRSAARIGDLAGDAAITPSTATRILDVLERREMVQRHRAPEDRRAVTVTLTERGRVALQRQDDWMRGRQEAFFAGLPATEQALAPDLLLRLAQLIGELSAGPG
jgi:DNA-binding MarR family transcriptional regulator